MLPQKSDAPLLLIIAGPNGSGKSSVYTDTDFEREGRSFWIVNPDLLARRIHESEAIEYNAANLAAVDRIAVWLSASINVHKSIGVETVLSTPKYREIVTFAQSRGFRIWLLYVLLDTPERNIERVRLRVEKGGHAVDSAKIVDRYHRSLQQLPWFLEQADQAWIYDNSDAKPDIIGRKTDGVVTLYPKAPQTIQEVVRSIETE